MLRKLAAPLLLAAQVAGGAAAAELMDATGRTVSLPAEAARIYTAGPPADVLVYVLKPQALIGWAHVPADPGLLRPEVRGLPELPAVVARDGAVDAAALAALEPDLVLDYGTVRPSYVEQARAVQQESGTPTILLDGALDAVPETLRELGAALAVAERGEALAAYAEATLAEVDETIARVPPVERPRVYYARGKDGLTSGGAGSINAEIVARAGAVNVVETEPGRNLVQVTPDQVAAWAPGVVLTQDPGFAAAAAGLPAWAGVPAVQEGRVLVAPASPFGFLDGPPSVNRLIGLRWLMHALYPEAAQGDLRDEVREFYALFYGAALDDAALDALLGAGG